MRNTIYVFCFIFILVSCTKTSNKSKKLSHYIPENTAIAIKTNSFETLESDLKNNDFLNELSSSNLLDIIKIEIKKFDSINLKNDLFICISPNNKYSFITKLSADINLNDSILNDANLFKTIKDSIAIVSTSKDIVESIGRSKNRTDPELEKLISSTKGAFSVFVNTLAIKQLTDSINHDLFKLNHFCDWMALDISMQQNQILFNGVVTINDTLRKLASVYNKTTPNENQLAKITPNNFDGSISFTFNEPTQFVENLRSYNSSINQDSTQIALFNSINEIGLIHKDDELVIALHSNDIIETKDALLSEQNLSTSFRQTDIFNFSKSGFFKSTMSPFVKDEINKYMVLDDFVVFSNSEDFLLSIISQYQNKSTLSYSDTYKDVVSNLSDESSMLLVANNENFKSVLKNIMAEGSQENIQKLNLKNYQFSALQFVQDYNFAHVNGIIQKNQSRTNKNTISEQFNIILDEDLLIAPQIVKNHRTNQKEIIVQDVNNNLYLISNRGKVLWKKRLNGNILGKVKQIDIYKNGRLQLAFATPKRVYVLDRNGKEVNPFPMRFNDEITQPLSVFDYDKKKNYRFLVTQGKNVLMYDSKGKQVSGFTFRSATSKIITQPNHFRIGTKDYIVFAAGNKLHILDRKGKTRIRVSTNFNFSSNEIFLYKGKFSFTNTKGELVQIDQKGRVTKRNLLLPIDHDLTTTSKTMVTLANNKLRIKEKTIELDFGNYTKPEIFYLRDKIYVAITDLQSQKALLFDSQTKSIQNFPVYGNSTLQLDNIDKDRNLEFIVIGEGNNLICYQIN